MIKVSKHVGFRCECLCSTEVHIWETEQFSKLMSKRQQLGTSNHAIVYLTHAKKHDIIVEYDHPFAIIRENK